MIDAVAALLKTEVIDETGAMEDEFYILAQNVILTQKDIRAIQLAKAAIAAGISSLLKISECEESDVSVMYLAGGFGSHLCIENAAAIGLISKTLAKKVQIIGNAALDGAAMLLMNKSLHRKPGFPVHHVRLDGNAYFSDRFVEEMLFDKAEDNA